jgi:hypothetical protein
LDCPGRAEGGDGTCRKIHVKKAEAQRVILAEKKLRKEAESQ